MGTQEPQPGQSIDILKQTLTIPLLAEQILQVSDLPPELSLLDLGAGDATTIKNLLTLLQERGQKFKNIGLVDVNIEGTHRTVADYPYPFDTVEQTQIVQVHNRLIIIPEFLKRFGGIYDVAISQLVLHQINDDHEASYYMYLAYRALKSTGDIFVVNLHPQYLEYLAKYEPAKFTITSRKGKDFNGIYTFDSSGTVPVCSRSIEDQLGMFLGLGFDFIKMMPITTEPIADQKERYRDLAERQIPMFYLLHLRKNLAHFISSSEGSVANIEPYNKQWIEVTFEDGEKIVVPAFKRWTEIKRGDQLVLQEVHGRRPGVTILNYWIINEAEEITGGQLIVSKT